MWACRGFPFSYSPVERFIFSHFLHLYIILIHCDASITDNGIGVGWHIQQLSDSPGETYSVNVRGGVFLGPPGDRTTVMAEYLACICALREGLRYSRDDDVFLYSDCEPVVRKIGSHQQVSDGHLRSMLDALLAKCESWDIMWVPRERNRVADQEARSIRTTKEVKYPSS